MTDPKQDAISAVSQMLANAQDNLHRASMNFRGLSDKEMNSFYGESGVTRRAIMNGYEHEVLRWKLALEFVEAK